MKFEKLALVLEELEKTSSGNKIREILANLFRGSKAEEIANVCYLVLGLIDAEYKGIVIGIAEKMALRSISYAAEKEIKEVEKIFKKLGDLGLVAEELLSKKKKIFPNFFPIKEKELTPNNVILGLRKIASYSGKGSQEAKIKTLASILGFAKPKEAKYIVRIALGRLRIGVGTMAVLDALSIAFFGSKKERPTLEHAYNLCNDIGLIARLSCKGIDKVKQIKIKVGRPIKMMLAQRIKKLSELKEHIKGKIVAEEKYDGERMQIHKMKNGEVVIYSRRLENITHQFPDVVEVVNKFIKGREFIVEGEAVPIDKKGNILEFQLLMQRKRKYDIEKYIKKIPVKLFLFDLLYLDGKSFIKKPYPERRKNLEKVVKENKHVALARQIVTENLDEIEDFFYKALERNTEGLVCKSTSKDSIYRAGARAWLWIKWKKEYAEELRDTFDVVVVGALAGRGLRAGTYGALLCAVYNKKEDIFETVCKLGTGFTEKTLRNLPKMFKKYKLKKRDKRIKAKIKADFWFEPKVVIEVTGGEITSSPVHTCAYNIIEKNKGLAIRFPRFIRFREDKSAEQATTTKEIIQFYKMKKR